MSDKKRKEEERKPQNDLEVVYYPDKAVRRELQSVPTEKRDRFTTSLYLMQKRLKPVCKVKQLYSIDRDVYELIINGSPAWRLVYYTGDDGKIVVLLVTDKTTEGRDPAIARTVELRLKAYREEQRKAQRRKR